jgi:photosystem II stability/assembly factor-like uncharacterized protein
MSTVAAQSRPQDGTTAATTVRRPGFRAPARIAPTVCALFLALLSGRVTASPAAPASLAGLSENLYGVDMLEDGRRVWAVGAFGSVFRSADGGRTWEAQETHVVEPLFDVAFADPEHGIVVGKSGIVLRTTDGGATWRRADGTTTKHLFKIAMIDPQRAWAVGDWGVVLSTSDGGLTWTDRSLGDDVVLSGVSFPDAEHGWIVGEFGTVLATRDGGQTWLRQAPGTSKTLFGVAFASPAVGWIVGIDGLVLRTGDGGESWAVQHGTTTAGSLDALGFVDLLTNPGLYDVAVVGGVGCVVGDTGSVLTTGDGGETWTATTLPEDVRLFWLRGVSMTKANGGILVGAKGLVMSIVDGEVVRPGERDRHGGRRVR